MDPRCRRSRHNPAAAEDVEEEIGEVEVGWDDDVRTAAPTDEPADLVLPLGEANAVAVVEIRVTRHVHALRGLTVDQPCIRWHLGVHLLGSQNAKHGALAASA